MVNSLSRTHAASFAPAQPESAHGGTQKKSGDANPTMTLFFFEHHHQNNNKQNNISMTETTNESESSNEDVEMALPVTEVHHHEQRGRLLEWNDISMTIHNKKKPNHLILNKVWGMAKPGETTAILGASGAGKTCLFRILAGRIQQTKRIQIDGQVCLDQTRIDPSKRQVRVLFAYVSQQDALHESSTVREAIEFSARLRCASSTKKEMHDKVESLIQELGLARCASHKISSLSGGERRRTSIAIELVSDPSILLLDEPSKYVPLVLNFGFVVDSAKQSYTDYSCC